jgi:hypothetical protein
MKLPREENPHINICRKYIYVVCFKLDARSTQQINQNKINFSANLRHKFRCGFCNFNYYQLLLIYYQMPFYVNWIFLNEIK